MILLIILFAILTFYRLVIGPNLSDKIIAMYSIGTMFLLVLVLLGSYFKRKIFIDVALVYGIFLFIDVLIMAKYLKKLDKGGAID